MLWLDMGLGKTIITLTALVERINYMQVYGTLIIAPLRVCQTVWMQEAANWSHTRHLRFRLIHGDKFHRDSASRTWADVWLINYENLPWFVDNMQAYYLSRGKYLPFNNIVIDEISKMKDPNSKRFGALNQILPYIPYRTGLTGTPAANGYKDLFGQYLAIDDGQRLGHNITSFNQQYCEQVGYGYSKYEVKEELNATIEAAVADITISMDRRDYLDLPDVIVNDIWVDMPPKSMAAYKKLEDEMWIELESGVEIEVANAAAKCNKCLQAANGALYIEPGLRDWDVLHDAKLDALEDVLEEAAGKPVLLCYEFQHDLERIMKKFKKARAFTGGMSLAQINALMSDWNAGKIPLLCGHPASMGHGLNLQHGGHIMVWYGLNWSLDLYQQANARLDRQGQKHPVQIHRLLTRGTLDHVQSDRLASKDVAQQGLREAIESYRKSVDTLRAGQ